MNVLSFEVVPEAELDRCVDHWVEDVLRCAPLSVRAIKQAALESEHLSLPEAFAARYERELERLQSADCEAGPPSAERTFQMSLD